MYQINHIIAVNPLWLECLTGLVAKASASRVEDPRFESRLPWLKNYGVSTGTGWPGVSIPWLGEMESLICNFYLNVAARTIVWADPSLRYTSMLLGQQASKQPTNQQSLLWLDRRKRRGSLGLMATSSFNRQLQFQLMATSSFNWWLQAVSTDGYKHFQLMATSSFNW